MSEFLYYLPNERKATPEKLVEVGLGYVFENEGGERNTVPCKGPDGGEGIFISPGKAGGVGYYPDKQTWAKEPAPGATFWIGIPNGWQPKPDELARRTMLRGNSVQLADNNFWQIPAARSYSESEDSIEYSVDLPRSAQCNREGDWIAGEVIPRYSRLYEIAAKFAEHFNGVDGAEDLSSGQMLDFAAEALSANYRISRGEISIAGLFTFQHAINVLRALVDQDNFEEIISKKNSVPASGNSSAGQEGSPQTTPQPSPT